MKTLIRFILAARLVGVAMLVTLASPVCAQDRTQGVRPKVRAITAFVRIDREHYRAQLLDAANMLRGARTRFQKDGWEVETIRITTQPFPEYVNGLSHDQSLSFLMEMDAMAEKEDFLLAIGPAMSRDRDDPAMMDLLDHTGPGHRFSVGLESANVVERAFAETAGDPDAAGRRLKADLAKYTSLAEASAMAVAKESGWEYPGLDPTPAPLMDVSIGVAIERFTVHRFGSSGTLTAARLITEAVKAVPARQVAYPLAK